MLKKKFVGIVVVLSTLVVLLAGTTVAFATGALSFDDFFRVRLENKANLEVPSHSLSRKRAFDPRVLITNVTDYKGDPADVSNVEISAINGFNNGTKEWDNLDLNDALTSEGTLHPRMINGSLYRDYKITFKYKYDVLVTSRHGASENVIEKSAVVVAASN